MSEYHGPLIDRLLVLHTSSGQTVVLKFMKGCIILL